MYSFNRLLPNGDRPVVWLPRDYSGEKAGLVFMPGTGTGWDAVFYPGVMWELAKAVTDAGHPVITTDAGIDEFGNARARSGIDDAIAWAQSSAVGVKPGPVNVGGFSQGGGSILSWAGTNPSRTLSITGVCALVDLRILQDAGGASLMALNNAFPPAYDQATMGAANNPQTMAEAGKYGSIPQIQMTSFNDGVIPPARVAAFKAAVGASARQLDLGAVGHDNSVPLLPTAIAALLSNLED